MQTKNVLYAAVGAPVVAARKVTDRVNDLKNRVSQETTSYTEAANKAIDDWAIEGEKVVTEIRDGKVVEEISHKVDLDQAKEQVSKLRDQLEDMLATWRQSFRPEDHSEKAPADKTAAETTAKASAAKSATAKKPAAKKPAAKKPAAKSTTSKPAAKSKASAAKTTKSSTAAKKSPAKSTSKSEGSKTKAS
ncbi:MAG: hypothetical protein ACLFRT_01410 [Actinomycetota bacterium]